MAENKAQAGKPESEADTPGSGVTYDPLSVEATRSRPQGLGADPRDLERQGDPAGNRQTK